MLMSLKQKETKFKPRIKLTHNIYIPLRVVKLLLRDSIYKYLLLRDAKFLLTDSIYKLYINKQYLLLTDA